MQIKVRFTEEDNKELKDKNILERLKENFIQKKKVDLLVIRIDRVDKALLMSFLGYKKTSAAIRFFIRMLLNAFLKDKNNLYIKKFLKQLQSTKDTQEIKV